MYNLNKIKINPIFYLIIVLIFFTGLTFAQNDQKKPVEEIANEYATRLERKVLLSNNQKANVKELLIIFIEDVSKGIKFAKAKEGVESKILALFNEKQDIKFDIIKNDFWKSLDEEIRKNLR